MGAATLENSMKVPQKGKKLKVEYDPAIPLLGTYSKELKLVSQRDTYIPMFIAALFIIATIWKLSKCCQ